MAGGHNLAIKLREALELEGPFKIVPVGPKWPGLYGSSLAGGLSGKGTTLGKATAAESVPKGSDS